MLEVSLVLTSLTYTCLRRHLNRGPSLTPSPKNMIAVKGASILLAQPHSVFICYLLFQDKSQEGLCDEHTIVRFGYPLERILKVLILQGSFSVTSM